MGGEASELRCVEAIGCRKPLRKRLGFGPAINLPAQNRNSSSRSSSAISAHQDFERPSLPSDHLYPCASGSPSSRRGCFRPTPNPEPLACCVELGEWRYVAAGDRPCKHFEEGVAIIGRAMSVMELA